MWKNYVHVQSYRVLGSCWAIERERARREDETARRRSDSGREKIHTKSSIIIRPNTTKAPCFPSWEAYTKRLLLVKSTKESRRVHWLLARSDNAAGAEIWKVAAQQQQQSRDCEEISRCQTQMFVCHGCARRHGSVPAELLVLGSNECSYYCCRPVAQEFVVRGGMYSSGSPRVSGSILRRLCAAAVHIDVCFCVSCVAAHRCIRHDRCRSSASA